MSDTFTPDEVTEIWKMKKWIQHLILGYGLPNDAVIAGGLFASYVQGEKPKDYDVFFLNKSFVVPYEKDGITSGLIRSEYQTGNPHVINVYNKNVIGLDFQFIVTDYKTREELLAGFDFKHCTMSFTNDTLYVTPSAYRAAKTKTLIGNNKTIKTWRIEKFRRKGYDWPKEEVKVVDTPVVSANPYAQAIRYSMTKTVDQTFASIIQEALKSGVYNIPDNNTTT